MGTNSSGGALVLYDCPIAKIINGSFSDNQSPAGAALAFTQYSETCSVTLSNGVFWGNSPQKLITSGPSLSVTNSCVQQLTSGPGNVVLSASPFVDADGADGTAGTADNDLQLLANACVNASDSSALPQDAYDLDGDGITAEPVPYDVAGQSRVVNGALDMGAYESRY
ncbi:hypothetical protein [Sorangium sp. So ce542]|uniref:hypothetical protein n=1 Tax=Sorangium sp. So ce542 TaxID=3133316 RepID=UPI003F5F9613